MKIDETQQKVIDANDEYNLVLAPPGCGKTELLTHRIIKAHENGVPFSDMLCLTFTNRASRGMLERIRQRISDPRVSDITVGNIHRFCSKFLFDNKIVPGDTCILDEIDTEDILDECGRGKLHIEEKDKRDVTMAILASSHRMRQSQLKHPAELYLYPETSAHFVNQKYPNDIDVKVQKIAESFLKYKAEHNLIDFDDILIEAYTALMSPTYKNDYQGVDFKWIQIDEVQDLNPMQFAIVDKIASSGEKTVMYLGDEQQAIFSFMGAKLSGLETLKKKCGGRVLKLEKNYRSPEYLLNVFNTYAESQLGISREFLPTTDNHTAPSPGDLQIVESEEYLSEVGTVCNMVRDTVNANKDDTVAVVVRYNSQADSICNRLSTMNIPHFKLSGMDVFKSETYKTLIAHLNVVSKDNSFMDWARLLYATKATNSFTDARTFVKRLRDAAMTPGDFISNPGSSYLRDFCKSYKDKEIVIFDTETTGLNVYEDDIIQIAAVKVRDGEIVPGSEYDVILHTDREIPAKLGIKDNPMVAVYAEREKLPRKQALEDFLAYIGDDEVLGHNSSYDLEILHNNVLRDCRGIDVHGQIGVCWDSLRLIRLIRPYLRVYKLESLLQVLGLEGVNSHKANDDILATKSLIDWCYENAPEKLDAQTQVMSILQNQQAATVLVDNYKPIYEHTRSLLDSKDADRDDPVMAQEMQWLYNELVEKGYVKAQDRMPYALEFLKSHIASAGKADHLRTQLQFHTSELSTFTEADLCESEIVREKVYVMTVYKAKGLEFDTVIVYSATAGTYPFFKNNTPDQIQEDKRVFYVAMSRAKKRLYVSYYKWQYKHQKRLTPFIQCVRERFRFRDIQAGDARPAS